MGRRSLSIHPDLNPADVTLLAKEKVAMYKEWWNLSSYILETQNALCKSCSAFKLFLITFELRSTKQSDKYSTNLVIKLFSSLNVNI